MKKSRLFNVMCVVLLTATPLSIVHAITVQLDFEATGFTVGSITGAPAPIDPVTGSIMFALGKAYRTQSTTLFGASA